MSPFPNMVYEPMGRMSPYGSVALEMVSIQNDVDYRIVRKYHLRCGYKTFLLCQGTQMAAAQNTLIFFTKLLFRSDNGNNELGTGYFDYFVPMRVFKAWYHTAKEMKDGDVYV